MDKVYHSLLYFHEKNISWTAWSQEESLKLLHHSSYQKEIIKSIQIKLLQKLFRNVNSQNNVLFCKWNLRIWYKDHSNPCVKLLGILFNSVCLPGGKPCLTSKVLQAGPSSHYPKSLSLTSSSTAVFWNGHHHQILYSCPQSMTSDCQVYDLSTVYEILKDAPSPCRKPVYFSSRFPETTPQT